MSIVAVVIVVFCAWMLLFVSFLCLCIAAKRADEVMLAGPGRGRGGRFRRRRGSSCRPSVTAPPGRSKSPRGRSTTR